MGLSPSFTALLTASDFEYIVVPNDQGSCVSADVCTRQRLVIPFTLLLHPITNLLKITAFSSTMLFAPRTIGPPSATIRHRG